MNAALATAAVILTLVGYFFIARRSRAILPAHPDEFFLAKGSADAAQYGSAQIAFALQMAAVYPFFTFTIAGQWWMAALNIIFWALGIVFFWVALPKFQVGAVEILGSSKTIHSAIARLHSAPGLRKFTACMTIFAFAGLAVFEVVWGSLIFKALFPGDSVTPIYYITVIAITAYLVLYIVVGGQLAAILTDQVQLVIGYLGLHGVLAWAIFEKGVALNTAEFFWIALAIAVTSALAIIFRLRNLKDHLSSWQMGALNALSIFSFTAVIVAVVKATTKLETIPLKLDFDKIYNTPNFGLILTFFITLPILFQFVDTSNWQRLAALKRGDSNGLKEARRGIVQYAIESPLSWLIPVAIGFCALQLLSSPAPAGRDPWVYLLETILSAPGFWGAILVVFVFAGVLAIFLSTAEGLLTAIGWAWAYDLRDESRRILDRHSAGSAIPKDDVWRVINIGRAAIVVAMIIVVTLFVGFDLYEEGGGQRLLGVFMAFYSPMISLAPCLLVPALFGRVCSPTFAVLSLGAGSVLGVLCGIVSLFAPSPTNEIFQWLSAPIALGVSLLIYVLGLAIDSRKLPSAATKNN